MVGFLYPTRGLRRVAARQALNSIQKRGYDGASKGRRTKNWKATNADASLEVSLGLSLLRARSRDLSRNSPYAAKALATIVSNVVGTGILARLDDEGINKNFQAWANSTACDFYGKQNFYQLQHLAMRTVAEAGEILVRKHRVADPKNPIQIQLLEPDFLDTTKVNADNRLRDGIEFDDAGRIVAYWLYEVHPGARANIKGNPWKSNRVDASEIEHIFRMDRPGQTRGVPWPAPVIIRFRDFDDYEDAQLVRQKIAACFVGFIMDNEDPVNQSSSTEEKKPMSERFEPGAWEVLPPGKDIKFGSPPGVGSDYPAYVRQMLLSIAAGYGVSYESLTGDLSQVNFSSGRMGWIEFHRNIESWRWNMFIPGFCETVKNWWLEGQEVASGKAAPENMTTTWTPPRREMIDPVKETEAMRDGIRSGLATLSDSVRQLGLDPTEHFAELESDFNMLKAKNLVLDCDPRNDLQSPEPSKPK